MNVLRKLALITIGPALLVSCATTNYDFSEGKFVKQVACNGQNNSWDSCIKDMKSACPNGYKLIRKDTHQHKIDGFAGPDGMARAAMVNIITEAYIGKDNFRTVVFECKK